MKKTTLSGALAVYLGAVPALSYADDVDINNMKFSGTNYVAVGTLSSVPGSFGFMESVDPFFDEPWAAAAVAYFQPGQVPTEDLDLATDEGLVSNNTIPAIFDDLAVNGAYSQTLTDNGPAVGGGTSYTWSGTADQLPADTNKGAVFSYDFVLSDNEVAWGTLFNWNTNGGIPVLVIIDCLTVPGVCSAPRGVPMDTAPFPTQRPKFSGGPPPLTCPDLFASTAINAPLTLDKADLIVGCTGGVGVVAITAIEGTTANGGSIGDNGTSLTFTPVTDLQGPDSFSFTLVDDIFTAARTHLLQVGGELQGNFTMMKGDGGTYGGANDVIFEWDQVTFNTDESDSNFDIIKISADTPFFAVKWNAHHIRVFDGGVSGRTLTFDTSCSTLQLNSGISVCGGGPMMELVIPPNMYGAHINFDWNGNTNIDVVNVWEPNAKWLDDDGVGGKNDLYQGAQGVTPHKEANWELVSRDVNGDGINGSPMIDGPFPNNYANFSWNPDRADLPPPPITTTIEKAKAATLSLNLWVLFSGFMLLVGMRKVKNNK